MNQACFTLDELLSTTQGRCVGKQETFNTPVSLSSDTRTLHPGCFFVPLRGASFDGHDYLSQARDKGAAGAFVSEALVSEHPEWSDFANLIAVSDPLQAYLEMARFHRRRINPKVVAVTGSSGKTTTKDMLYWALSRRFRTQKTEKNYNNEIGLCQTLLALQPGTEVLIAEMAMRGRHQIDLLSHYGEPDIGVVINVGPAHIGLLGSIENIALAKCEIFDGMNRENGVGVVNGDDTLLLETAQKTWPGRLEVYRLTEAKDMAPTPDGGVSFVYQGRRITLPLPGSHIVSNALAVLTVGALLGMTVPEIAEGLAAYQPESGRWEKRPLEGYRNSWVINDAYNANPSSMKASLASFFESETPGLRRILILGAMNELGDFSRQYHQELGAWLATQRGVDTVYAIGDDARWMVDAASEAPFSLIYADNIESVVAQLIGEPDCLNDMLLFLKGSRSFRLEEIPLALARQVHGAC